MISILIPAYNEEKRIKPFLKELKAFLKTFKKPYEVLLVNDGSTDKTVDVVKSYSIPNLRIVSHERNRGKGAAIKTGLLKARGEKIMFMDADGSIPAKEIEKMDKLLDHHHFATGSRIIKGSKITCKQPIHRIIAGRVFNQIVNWMFDVGTKDTLCGFKGVRKDLGKKLAKKMISTGWEFDVELLARTKKMGYDIGVFPIEWHDVRGSRLSVLRDPIKMFFGLLKLRTKI